MSYWAIRRGTAFDPSKKEFYATLRYRHVLDAPRSEKELDLTIDARVRCCIRAAYENYDEAFRGAERTARCQLLPLPEVAAIEGAKPSGKHADIYCLFVERGFQLIS